MKKIVVVLLILLIYLIPVKRGIAQDQGELKLRMSRDFGYSSGTGKIQGTFTLKASGPDDLESVTFYLDGEPLGQAAQPPFELRFHTDSYPLGLHTLYAVGLTAAGRELRSNEIRAEFVSAEEGWQAGVRILFPLLGLIAIAMLISFAATMLTSRKMLSLPPGAPRKYGFSGGAICPNCKRPFPLPLFSINLGLRQKLSRCPFCGKWSVLRPLPIADLRLAEQAELQAALQDAQIEPESEEEKLRKELDDSRFQDL
jgi:hypothetical protein